MAAGPIRALTAPHPITPTSPRCPSARQPNPGRRSTYRRGKSVQTTGTSSIAYLIASDWELWQARAERLTARWPLMALLALHGAIFVGGIHDVVFKQMLARAEPPINSWFGLIYFEGI